MKTLLTTLLVTSTILAAPALATSNEDTEIGQGSPEVVLSEASETVRIEIKGGMMGEDIVKTFTQEDLHGIVFGQLADARQVDLKETFCVADLPVKTITVTDEFGNETQYRSSEQNCWDEDEELARFGSFAPRYLDYVDMNTFLDSLGLPTIAID